MKEKLCNSGCKYVHPNVFLALIENTLCSTFAVHTSTIHRLET